MNDALYFQVLFYLRDRFKIEHVGGMREITVHPTLKVENGTVYRWKNHSFVVRRDAYGNYVISDV